MRITEIRFKIVQDDEDDRLRAYVSIVVDDWLCVRDLKIVVGYNGKLIVSMPCRKMTDRCFHCGGKNQVISRYCHCCGVRLPGQRHKYDDRGRPKLFADTVHPITKESRALLDQIILEAYSEEMRKIGVIDQGESSTQGEES